MYTKVAWEMVVKYVKVGVFSFETLLQGFDQTCSAKGVLGRRDNMELTCNWKQQGMYT